MTAIEGHRREIERIASASARFVPREFLKVLKKESIVDIEPGDQIQHEMTIMFSDVRSFTTISEGMSPKENFDFINRLPNQSCPVIREYHGFVDKYLGDGIMALFPRQADDAGRAAIAMRKQLALYNEQREERGLVPIQIGIGLHSGLLIDQGYETMAGSSGDDWQNIALYPAETVPSPTDFTRNASGTAYSKGQRFLKQASEKPLGSAQIRHMSQP